MNHLLSWIPPLLVLGLSPMDPATLIGMAFWSLGFYWVFSPLHTRMLDHLEARMQAWHLDPFLGISSLATLLPWLGLGAATVTGIETWLNPSWSVSWGLLFAMAAGIYELGRFDSQRRLEQEQERLRQQQEDVES